MAEPNAPQVMMISKPISPPWNDSAKNIVMAQLSHARRYKYRALTIDSGKSPDLGSNVTWDPIYDSKTGFSPNALQKMKVMLHGLNPRGAKIYHYFFAPNPLTSKAGRLQRTLARVKTVQSVCSCPASFDDSKRLLFSELVVVLSDETRKRLISAGIEESRIRLVRPGINPIEKPSKEAKVAVRHAHGLPTTKPIILFPGDWEFSGAAETVASAVPIIASAFSEATVVFACRSKTKKSQIEAARIMKKLEPYHRAGNALYLEKTSDMPALLGSSDVVVMPTDNLYAKMDAPLALIEAMFQGVPLVLANTPPLDELLLKGGGLSVPPGDPESLAHAVLQLLGDSVSRGEIGDAGAKAARDMFTASSMTERIETIYDELLGEKN